MSKTISHRPPRAKDHAASTRTDSRPASGKKQKEPVPSVATAFEMLGSSISKFKKDVGDTTRRLAKSARVFAHTIRTETGRPDKSIVQVIENGFADAAQALAPKPDFTILADEAEAYLDTIRHLAKSDPKLKPAALEMAAQYQGILGAGIATAVWDYQHDPDSRPVAQRQAMDFADAFYREAPTAESLDGVFATYAAVDRDVAKLRRAVARNTETIRTHVSNDARIAAAPLLAAADRSLPMGDIQFQKPVPVGPEAIFLQSADQSHVVARAENAILEPLLTSTESRITTLVQSTHVDSKFYREAHLGMAHVHMGDPQTGVRHLESARMIFRDKGEVKPPAKELSTQIEVLHRIATNSPGDVQLAKDRLSEADSMIDLLALDKGSRDKATLFRIDNLLHTLPHRIQEHDENLKHNPDNIEGYHRAVAREHQKIIDYCAKVKSKDPAIVALAHGNGMIQASVQFEKRLDAAMSLRLMGETDDARKAHLDAQNKFTQTLWTLEHTASPAFMHEAMGRMHWANATYTFKTGAVEESLRDLRTLSTTYGASGAAQILKDGSGGDWVHHYGIVDDHGNFSPDIGKPSEVAKWKKIADAALDDKASAMKAMMAGAGVAIVGAASADALFGTHVIGAEVLGGLTLGKIAMVGAGAGLITERGYQVLSAQREISAAYTTGIANVTTAELADRGKALAGEVAVCFLAGGAARYVRMGVTTLGAGLRAPLLRGLISESGIVAEGIAFHEFAGAIHGETDRSALGYFRSILTLRMLAAGSELNLGSLLFPGEKWADAVMRHGFNTAVSNIPLQAFESAIARDLSGFGQGYFDGLFGLYAITVGGKVPGTILRAPQIMAQAKAIHQERSARKLITRAETLANKISTLQSNRDYARTPTEKVELTQKLITAMRAHADAYQKLAKMGLYPAKAATAYADGVEAFANVSEAAAQPAFETTPLRQLIARALLLPVAPIFGMTGPIGGGPKKPGPTEMSAKPLSARNMAKALHAHYDNLVDYDSAIAAKRNGVPLTPTQQKIIADPEMKRLAADRYAFVVAQSGALPPTMPETAPLPFDSQTAQQFPSLAHHSSQIPIEALPMAVQKLIQDTAEFTRDTGFENACMAIEGGKHIIAADERVSSNSERQVTGDDIATIAVRTLQTLEAAVLDGELTQSDPIRIYSFHTHPYRESQSQFVKSPNHVHSDARPYTWTNDADLQSTQARFKFFVESLRAKGFTGPIELWAGALPSSGKTSDPNLIPIMELHPYIATTRMRSESAPAEGAGPKLPEGNATQVGIKRGLGDKPPEVSEPPQPPPQPQKQTQQLRPRIPVPALVFTPREPVGRVQVELAPPEHREQAQKHNVRLLTQGDEAAFADAGAINHFDSGLIFLSPYAPSLFFVTAKVDAATGAIRSMKASDQKTERTPNTFSTSITVFSPWALAQLSQLHSEALKRGVSDRDPVPEWVLTKISEIVETRDKITAEGVNKGELIQVQTQYIKWFSFINSRELTLGDVFSDRVISVSSERLPTEIEVDLQTSLVGKPFRTQNALHIKQPSKPSGEEPSRPAWLDDPRIANALWAVNPEYAPDMQTVSPQFKFNPKGDNGLVYAILDISRAIAAGSPLTNSYLSRLHHLLEAIAEHSDLFRPEARVDTASTESNLDAHLRAAYSESPNVVLRALELLEDAFETPGAFRGKLRPDFRATQPVNRPGVQKVESSTTPKAAEDGLAVSNDAGVRKELKIPEPVVAPPKPTPPLPADIDVIQRHTETLAVALNGNLNDTIPEGRYSRRDLTGLTSPSGGESTVRARINAQTGEPLTLGLTPDVPGVEYTAVIDIRISSGKVIGVNTNSNQLLHPTVLDSIRRNLLGKPAKAKPLKQTKPEPPDTPDVQGSTPPQPNPVATPPNVLALWGEKRTTQSIFRRINGKH